MVSVKGVSMVMNDTVKRIRHLKGGATERSAVAKKSLKEREGARRQRGGVSPQ